MLVYAFVLFLVVKGGIGQVVECNEDPVPFCSRGIRTFEIPNSEQEFTELSFLSNVVCLKITFSTHYPVCELRSQYVVEDYKVYLRDSLNQSLLEPDQETDASSHSLHCLESLISVACVLHQVGVSCGSLSKLSLLLLIRKSGFLLRSCSLADLENLNTLFISYLETKQDVKGMIEEAFWFESNRV
ncbi:uncharacterized protein LOC129226534 [Uloborus diversus]|uniref:uncharacterized protein LOC129226534 n=1 Tax=Uloborus diversus TaxID=327109 RepID=UPI0024097AB0|nr:uncharacterized protein LOC129226534 [Uloborus diversus]